MQPLNSLLQDKGVSRSEPFSLEKQNVLNSEFDHSLRYFFIFLFFGGGAAIWLSYVLMMLRFEPTGISLINIGIVATFFLLVMLFQSILIRSTQFNFFLVLIEALLLPLFSYTIFSPWFAIATAVFIVAWWFGYSRARVMINAVLKINFWHYSSLLISGSITALAIFLACFYVGLYERAGGLSFNTYRLVTSTLGIEYVTPNFNPEIHVDSFLEDFVRAKITVMPDFKKLAPTEQDTAIKETAKAIGNNVVAFTKLAVEPGESLLQYTYRVVIKFLHDAQAEGYGFFVIGGMILGIFFVVQGLMYFVKWPVLFLAFILYILLQAIGIISIGAEMRQKEVIVVK